MTPPRFAVDKMLGRLAIWLRLIGHDATYGSHLAGRALVRHARAEGRTILTRDGRLLRLRDLPPVLFVESNHFRDQLRQVVAAFNLDPFAHIFTRCSRCNQPVYPVEKQAIIRQIPPYVSATQEHFVQCPRCRRIYWPATHYERVRQELQAMGFHSP